MKKTISIFLSLLMLASSSGIAYSQHFCGGLEMNSEITFGEKNISCGMEIEKHSCVEESTAVEVHKCCENQFTKVKTDDNFAKASFTLKFQKTFVATFVSVFVLPEVEIAYPEKTFFADYSPPPLEQDFNILYETFLI